MNIISIICFSLFLVLLISLFKKGSDILSPARLFLIIWSLTFGLVELKLSRFQYEWSAYSWIVILLCIGGALIGMYVVYVINFNHPVEKIKTMRDSSKTGWVNEKLLFNISIFLFVCYIVSYVAIYYIEGFIPFFTLHPDMARSEWGGMFGIGLLVQTLPSIMLCITLYFMFVKGKKLKKLILINVAVISVITYTFTLQRYYLIFPIVIYFVFLYYFTNKLTFSKILIMVLVFVGIFYGISSIRASKFLVNIIYYVSDMKYSPKYSAFTEPYMYFTMNLENFAYAAEKIQHFYYGFFSFDFVLSVTGLKHSLNEYITPERLPMITNTFNTYSMFFQFYHDFGVFGAGFLSFLFGTGVSTLYYRMKKLKTINSVSIYAIVVFVILFSFLIPIISWLIFVFNVFVIYMVTNKIQMKYRD